ncbi:UNVERIFIED_CONTAM: ArsR family transcriptional regulator [Acetivibrio alkalicellulosi]
MAENMGNQLVGKVFKVLSSPTRIHILRLLKDGPLCVCKIIEALGTEQSNTSQHLSSLKNVGLIQSRKEGLKVIYSIKYSEIFETIDIIEKIILMQTEETQKSIKMVI